MANLVFDSIQAFGSLATVGSLIWAIKTYQASNEDRDFQKIKEAILILPQQCIQLNKFLNEPFFASIGNSIAGELKNLYTEKQTLEDFSKFLLSDLSSNYKALAVYQGLKQCQEIKEINNLLNSIDQTQRIIVNKLPLLGRIFSHLLFYIEQPSSKTISSNYINANLRIDDDDDDDSSLLKGAIKKAMVPGTSELYFKEFAVLITNICRRPLGSDHLGQKTLDLSITMVKIIANAFPLLKERDIRKLSKKDKAKFSSYHDLNNKHAIQDAMEMIKEYRKLFDEEKWEKLIECKGRIIQLMDKDKNN